MSGICSKTSTYCKYLFFKKKKKSKIGVWLGGGVQDLSVYFFSTIFPGSDLWKKKNSKFFQLYVFLFTSLVLQKRRKKINQGLGTFFVFERNSK